MQLQTRKSNIKVANVKDHIIHSTRLIKIRQ
jgi:hypothetical protein